MGVPIISVVFGIVSAAFSVIPQVPPSDSLKDLEVVSEEHKHVQRLQPVSMPKGGEVNQVRVCVGAELWE